MELPKNKILKKAFTLFLTRSYESVTIREIQSAVDVSRGAIYHHFKSKEEIYEEVIKEYLLPAFNTYSFVSDEDRPTLKNAVLASIKNRQQYVSFLVETTTFKLVDYYFFKFVFQAIEHSKHFREQANLSVEKEFNAWRQIIQSAMRNGEIRADIDIDYIAQSFISAPFGLGFTSAFSNYININTNDVRTTYLRFYSLIEKNRM